MQLWNLVTVTLIIGSTVGFGAGWIVQSWKTGKDSRNNERESSRDALALEQQLLSLPPSDVADVWLLARNAATRKAAQYHAREDRAAKRRERTAAKMFNNKVWID